MLIKSIQLDYLMMRLPGLGLGFKLSFIIQKYVGILFIFLGLNYRVRHGNLNYYSQNLSDIGTLQSCIIDTYEVMSEIGKTKSVLDVGANVGQFANSCALLWPEAKIVSVEPNPRIIDTTIDNTVRINVDVRNIGLGVKNSYIDFYVSPNSLTSSFTPNKGDEVIKVSSKRGDDEFSGVSFDLIKIDVEGFEYKVIEGMEKLLKRSKFILIELSFDRSQEKSNLEVLYKIKEICPHSTIIRFGRELRDGKKILAQDVLIKT